MPLFAEVIPFVRLPRNIDVFDYIVPHDLQKKITKGTVVSVPLRKKQVLGFVSRLKEKSAVPTIKLRAISKVEAPSVLSNRQLELFEWMAKNYAISPSIIIKMFFPITSRSFFRELNQSDQKLKKANPKFKHPWLKNHSFLIQYDNRAGLLKEYDKIAAEFSKSGRQLLIIFPRINLLKQYYGAMPESIKKNAAVYHITGIRSKDLQDAYQAVKNNKAKIILGTRPALFAPFANLSAIIVDHEESPDHKQIEPNPRYHTIEVAEFLQETDKNLKIIYASPLPSLERYSAARDKKIAAVFSPSFEQPSKQVEILDIRHPESYRATYPFHQNLENAAAETLKNGFSVFILVNRRGEAGALVCADCGWSPLCPDCGINLSIINESKINETLVCFQCGFKRSSVPFCPSCQSPKLKYRGLGVQKAAIIAKKLFPKTPIVQITKEIKSDGQKNDDRPKIIMGTPTALDSIDFSNIGLIGVVSSDGALISPEFRAAERFGGLLFNLAAIAPESKIFIQTFSPDNKIFNIFKNSPKNFLEEELEARRSLNYPPFAMFIKIIISGKNRNETERAANLWIEKTKNTAEESDVEILGPIEPRRPFVRGRMRQNIILRTGKSADIEKIIKLVPESWIIDKNPENLL